MKKELSIIIPHYNSTNKLKNLLNTIEFNEKTEVIIIDDCSNIQEQKKLREITSDLEVKIKFNKNNLGAGYSRNVGIDISNGNWLLFADSDDLLFDNYYNTISEYFNSDNDIVFFKPTSQLITKNNSIKKNRHSFYERLITESEKSKKNYLFLKYQFTVPWSKLYNREFLSSNQLYFDETYHANDVMFSTKSSYYSKNIAVDNHVIYCSNEYSDSLTGISSFQAINERVKVYCDQYTFLEMNLSKEDFNRLEMLGIRYIFISIKSRFSIAETFSIYKTLKENNVKILSVRGLSSKIKRYLKENLNSLKYYRFYNIS